MRIVRTQIMRQKAAPVLLAAVLLAGCSSADIPGVYRIDIQQGNVVTQDMLARLEPGMSRRQVRFILGTPLLVDTFNESRWDYIYSFKSGTGRPEQRAISVHFDNERLTRLEGDISASANIAPAQPRRQSKVVKVDNSRDRGFLETLNPFDDGPEKGTLPQEDVPSENTEQAAPDDESSVTAPANADARDASINTDADTEVLTRPEEPSGEAASDSAFDADPEPPPSIWERFRSTVGLDDRETASDGQRNEDAAPDAVEPASTTQAVTASDDAARQRSGDARSDQDRDLETENGSTAAQTGDVVRTDDETRTAPGGDGSVWDRLRETFSSDAGDPDGPKPDLGSPPVVDGPGRLTNDEDPPPESETESAESGSADDGGAVVEERDTADDADGGFFSKLRERIKFPGGLFGSDAAAGEPEPAGTSGTDLAPVEEPANPIPASGQ